MNLLTQKNVNPAGVRRRETDAGTEVFVSSGVTADFLLDDAEVKGTIRFFLEKGSRVEVLAFACGDGSSTHTVEAEMTGSDSFFSFKGLGVLSDADNRRFKVTARHGAPGTVSRQLYKSILSETAFSEFETVVAVRKNAPRSDSRQLCRNLLLSDRARAISRPILNIDQDDVSCTHGATTGAMEESELFYLRSRGLTEASAKELLVYAFAQEVLEALTDPSLRARFESLVRAKLTRILKER